MAAVCGRRFEGDSLLYKVILPHHKEIENIKENHLITEKKIVKEAMIKCVIGPGDNMEPIITIMLPNEA